MRAETSVTRDVLGEDQRVEARGKRRRQRGRHVGEEMIAALVDPQVGDHSALRRQIGRVDAGPGVERRDVVGDERLEKRRRVAAVEAQPAAVAARRQPAPSR